MDINQDYQELSQTNHSLPNKITKTYISFHGEQCIWEKLFLANAYDTKCMQSRIQGSLYIMLHMPCQMQEMHKRKLYICYKGALTQPTQEIKQTPSSPRKPVKVDWSRGLVKISATWSCVGTWIKVILPFSTLSLRKWYLTSMCFVLEWSTRFFATLMALVLSHWSETWVYSSPKSLMVYVIQRSWEQ
jgi:hypothetical protein